jgi:hypothetical protein
VYSSLLTEYALTKGGALSPLSFAAPILFGLALHRRRGRVLDLDPVIRPAGSVGRAQPLGHNAFATQRAGGLVDGSAIALVMDIEGNAVVTRARNQWSPALPSKSP